MKISISHTEEPELKKIFIDSEFRELVDVTSGKGVSQKAKVALSWSEEYLFLMFKVKDEHIWGTYRENDDPIYEQEAVEAFFAYGQDDPKEYFELQFSPNLIKYDAWVKNPTGNRHDKTFKVDVKWNFKNLEFEQDIDAVGDTVMSGEWLTYVKIPAVEIKGKKFVRGDILRGNLFRIDGYPKQNSFQALKPNFQKTPNFHTPKEFAIFELV